MNGMCSTAEGCPIYWKTQSTLAIRWGKTTRLAVMLPPRTRASTTDRPWAWLELNSSAVPLLHGHGNSKASVGSQCTSN